MDGFVGKLKAASDILFEAEKEVETASVDLPAAEASGILVAARHLIERVLSFTPATTDHDRTASAEKVK